MAESIYSSYRGSYVRGRFGQGERFVRGSFRGHSHRGSHIQFRSNINMPGRLHGEYTRFPEKTRSGSGLRGRMEIRGINFYRGNGTPHRSIFLKSGPSQHFFQRGSDQPQGIKRNCLSLKSPLIDEIPSFKRTRWGYNRYERSSSGTNDIYSGFECYSKSPLNLSDNRVHEQRGRGRSGYQITSHRHSRKVFSNSRLRHGHHF